MFNQPFLKICNCRIIITHNYNSIRTHIFKRTVVEGFSEVIFFSVSFLLHFVNVEEYNIKNMFT